MSKWAFLILVPVLVGGCSTVPPYDIAWKDVYVPDPSLEAPAPPPVIVADADLAPPPPPKQLAPLLPIYDPAPVPATPATISLATESADNEKAAKTANAAMDNTNPDGTPKPHGHHGKRGKKNTQQNTQPPQ